MDINKLYSDVWEDFPYSFKPDRILNLDELNAIMYVMFAQKVFDEEFYKRLPEELKEFFVEREEEKPSHFAKEEKK